MAIAHFILNAVSDRPYTEGRRLARERVISRSRAYRELVLCQEIKQKRSKELRQTQMFLRMRKLLPMLCQTTACTRNDAEQKWLSECADSIDWLNKPCQVALFEFDNRLKEYDLTNR